MCKCLKVSRRTFYYLISHNHDEKEDELTGIVVEVFNENFHIYGTRRLRATLLRKGIATSRRRIRRIMIKKGLESVYTCKKYKNHKSKVNEKEDPNLVKRKFRDRKQLEVVVSDLTYVRVGANWNYICLLLDLHNREIIGYSCGKHKNAKLVEKAISTIKTNLYTIEIFHSDRGSEFDNYLMDECFSTFHIKSSLSKKGCPYDNAVAEAQFKIIKKEFVRARRFISLEHLQFELERYVNWFNQYRLHSTLGYLSPNEYKIIVSQKVVQ